MAAEGRAADMEEVYKQQYPVVRQFALSMSRGRAADVEDVVQMAFLALYTVLESGREVKNVRPFLFSAVRRAFVDFERKTQRERDVRPAEWLYDELDQWWKKPYSVEDDVLAKLQADYLLGSLPSGQARVLLLFSAGLSTNEIAASLAISPQSVKSGLARARHNLRQSARQSLDELDPRPPASKPGVPAPPLDAYEWIFGLDRVVERLRQTYAEEAAREWLVRPSSLLDERRPIDLLRAGEARRVQGAIDAVAEGVFV